MKKYLLLPTLLILFLFQNCFSQCDTDDFMDDCAEGLGNFKFVRSHKIGAKDDKKASGPTIEYKILLSKGNIYEFLMCTDKSLGGDLVINLYDRNRKLILSNYNKQKRKIYPDVNYECSATGVYYISYEFQGGNGCGINIIGVTN